MPSASRPVKVACLACRASKTRCDGQQPCANCSIHQEECRYQPSRRGGARRGPLAAQKLARKRAQRAADIANINNHDEFDSNVSGQGYNFHSHLSAPFPFPSMSRSTISLEFPSPPSGFVDQQESSGGTVELPGGSIRVYRCDQDLINAYYIFIHPYFPCLPPPAASQYEDTHEVLSIRPIDANPSILPYWPASSLGLAIAAILVLIPPLSGKPHDATQGDDDNTVKLRRSYADLFARSALESLEESLVPPFNVNSANHSLQSTLHPEIPQKMEPVLALELLSLYECCHRMNVSKMRLRANQALTVAMDLSLHTQDQWTGCLDAQRRCWWATIFLVYLSSIMSSAVPIITFDDSRITTVFPEFRGCREPWPLLVNAEVVLLRSCQIGRQLIRENSNNESIPRPDQGLPHSIGEEIRALDALILELAAEADRFLCVTNYQGPEADASRNLWAISNALIHTARITLHRTRAFLDPPVLLDQHCDVLATETSSSYSSSSSTTTSSQPTTQRRQLSTPRAAEISSFFPFTEEQSEDPRHHAGDLS